MKIAILTNEYPPHVYGGAGVHVEYLTKELSQADQGSHSVNILCFGNQKQSSPRMEVQGIHPHYQFSTHDPRHAKLLDTLYKDLVMAGTLTDVDIAHCHTWYSHFAGLLAKQLLRIPLVLTTHSLEPHRPWKSEQLGTAYTVSSWIEKAAYQNADGIIAVSEAMKHDVHALYGVDFGKIQVIHNGIDINQYTPTLDANVLTEYGIDTRVPYVLFVGRITRQKGILHLVNAIKHIQPGCQIVLCAGAPDTKEINVEMEQNIARAKLHSKNTIFWITEMVPKEKIIALYSQAAVFVCPSVYEPFGIINLEAMACQTPVVAAAVGGIPEVVVPGETGILVPLAPKSSENGEPADPETFAQNLADAINTLLDSPDTRTSMGIHARQRVIEHFSWTRIAAKTIGFYKKCIDGN